MLNLQEATKIVNESLPGGVIQISVKHGDLYLFQVFTDIPGEEQWDPFYSVNQKTGEFRDFSILTDGGPEIVSLLRSAKGGSSGN